MKNNMSNNTPPLYALTPIDQTEGLENGTYRLADKSGKGSMFEWSFKNGRWTDLPNNSRFTHYLRPLPPGTRVLQPGEVGGALEFGKPQMNIASMRDKMKEFFDTVTPDELIREFELLGYEFKPIDGQSR